MSASRVRTLLLIAGMLTATSARNAHTQASPPPGVLAIWVRDSLGRSVAGAELTLDGTTVRGVTDERGELRLSAVRAGPATVRVRRLGFHPTSVDVVFDSRAGGTSTVTLTPIPQNLAPVVVKAGNYTGRMAGFYHRRDQGIGSFITRERLEDENPTRVTDVMRRLPGVQVRSTPEARNAVRFRGHTRNGGCWPLVWLDGAPLAAGEFDLDVLSPKSIEGIEVYSGIAQIPSQFIGMRDRAHCGVIVVWSREGQPRPKKAKKAVSATQLAELVESLQVYTSGEVDVPARSDSVSRPQPLYPEAMLSTGARGDVLVEFVVDTLGHVELDTFGVISSTSPAFTAAVQRVLPDWSYTPAMRQGKRVRQLVQQPFSFEVDSSFVRRASRP